MTAEEAMIGALEAIKEEAWMLGLDGRIEASEDAAPKIIAALATAGFVVVPRQPPDGIIGRADMIALCVRTAKAYDNERLGPGADPTKLSQLQRDAPMFRAIAQTLRSAVQAGLQDENGAEPPR